MPSDDFTVDDICQAVIREYLKKSGCEETFRCFLKEKAKGENTITRRSVLVSALRLNEEDDKYRRAEKPRPSVLSTLVLLKRRQKSSGVYTEESSPRGWRIPVGRSDSSKWSIRRLRSASLDRTPVVKPAPTSSILRRFSSKTTESTENEKSEDSTETYTETVDLEETKEINSLLWGGSEAPMSWRQGFFFCANPGMEFGLVQSQAGPCGLIACIQGHFIAESLSPGVQGKVSWSADFKDEQLRKSKLTSALSSALLLAAGDSDIPVRVVSTSRGCSTKNYPTLLKHLTYRSCDKDLPSIKNCLAEVLDQYMCPTGWGLILFMLSLLLTKGVQKIREEMDDSEMSLIGEGSSCSQELVNLLLTGRATTNVFDGRQSFCNDSTQDRYLMTGVENRSRLGLLTLLEWNNYVEVGSHLKSPKFPVWVICAESHFTVLFASGTYLGDLTYPFHLLHYDPLSVNSQLSRLIMTKCSWGGLKSRIKFSRVGERDVSILERVVSTKWPDASVFIKSFDVVA